MSGNQKKILLIGKTGQLGGALFKIVSKKGLEVFAPGADKMDIRDKEKVKERTQEFRPDILINTAAYQLVAEAEKKPQDAFLMNEAVVKELALLCKKYGIKFVTYSTDYVFDGKKGSPYIESDIPNPLQVYGVSKVNGEHAAVKEYSEGTYIIRTCGLYGGKTGSPAKGNFVLNIVEAAEGKESIEVSSEQIVSPTSAEDLAEATLKLLQKNAKPGIYHLVNEGYCSWAEFTDEIFLLAGIKTKVIPVDRGGKRGKIKIPKFSALKNVKAKKLGIVLPPWKKGLADYIKFLNE